MESLLVKLIVVIVLGFFFVHVLLHQINSNIKELIKRSHNSGYTGENPPQMPSSCVACDIDKSDELCIYGDDACLAALWRRHFS